MGLADALRKMESYEAYALKKIGLPTGRTPAPTLLRTHPDTSERIRRLLELAPVGHPVPVPVAVCAAWSKSR